MISPLFLQLQNGYRYNMQLAEHLREDRKPDMKYTTRRTKIMRN